MITQEKVNKMALPHYSGRYHTLISKAMALELLRGTEFENHRKVACGSPDAFPENYFFTVSSLEHVGVHVKCGTPVCVNAMFLNDAGDSTSVLASIPVKAPGGWGEMVLCRVAELGGRVAYDPSEDGPFHVSVDGGELMPFKKFYSEYCDGLMPFADLVRVLNLKEDEKTYVRVEGSDAPTKVRRASDLEERSRIRSVAGINVGKR